MQNLNQFESNGIIKVLGTFITGIKSKKVSLQEITKLQSFLCSIPNDQFMQQLMLNLLNISALTLSQHAQQRAEIIQQVETQLTILSSWSTLHCSLIKNFNSENHRGGIDYFSSQAAYSKIFRSILMLVNEIDSENAKPLSCLVVSGNSMFGNIGGDTNKIQVLLNETKSKTLQFLKIVWQFLWLVKPKDIYCADNPFVIDAHYFINILTETLIRLP